MVILDVNFYDCPRFGPHTHPDAVSRVSGAVSTGRTHYGNLPSELIFDFADLDSIRGMFVDDRRQLYIYSAMALIGNDMSAVGTYA